ncbi:MAG: SMI1/KNR4 family protein [Phycisphaerales bacterium]|nr:SMI1/KNR4 family protein [Phycisphaerales bacterium]
MLELGLLPIAEDDCGNCFCISTYQSTLNAVYYWDDDSVLDLGIATLRVADDLATFFALIRYKK